MVASDERSARGLHGVSFPHPRPLSHTGRGAQALHLGARSGQQCGDLGILGVRSHQRFEQRYCRHPLTLLAVRQRRVVARISALLRIGPGAQAVGVGIVGI